LLTGVQAIMANEEGWDRLGQVYIVQNLPLPATVLGVSLEYTQGVL